MARPSGSGQDTKKTRRRPATSPAAREKQLISMAVELAERQLAEGTASSQVITHYLKLGSTRERLEQEKLAHENELMVAKTEALASSQRIEELYTQALSAMKSYSGDEQPDAPDDD